MHTTETRLDVRHTATHRSERKVNLPKDSRGQIQRVSEYFGCNTFDFRTAEGISPSLRKELIEVSSSGKRLTRENAEVVAAAATEWAISRGATHFCHWFQPLTGNTAEKHDAFLTIKDGKPIERLSGSQLMQGEPDASSFPNGGSRATFEARGYTAWDLTSPMFLMEGPNGKTLCIPTAFVSYTGQALDIKTPVLRSDLALSRQATRFLNLIGMDKVKHVHSTCGCEQEYFLIDKAFYYARPDLVMTGRTLFGNMSAKNQQLDDHYFGDIDDRVMSYMQELDHELYKLGIPAKTRHNEVAPGQYEMAPIFSEANVAADNNQLVMAVMRKVAAKHNFVCVLHEKPFAGINGSGKHMNWSMSSDTGLNLLEPGDAPHENARFLAVIAVICEAVHRHAKLVRAAIASAGNDHRLGANEAPPSIISAYLGDTLGKIFTAIRKGESYSPNNENILDMGASQLATLLKDNTDRNRTSPFAFTGNKFELRAVGSDQAVGLPLTILNAAVSDVLEETNNLLEADIKAGKNVDDALAAITKKWVESSDPVVFNGDGYSDDWLKEAERRGLPNLRTTADSLPAFVDKTATAFLTRQGVFTEAELETRYNVALERYNTIRGIEFSTLMTMINQQVTPALIEYKGRLGNVIKNQKDIGLESTVEVALYKELNAVGEKLYKQATAFRTAYEGLGHDELKAAETIARELMPASEDLAATCAEVEELIPDGMWPLPKYFDMLFLR